MRIRTSRILCHLMAFAALMTVPTGCVKRMSAANETAPAEVSAFGALQSVTVSPDANRIEIVSDRPLTYTSYKAGEPFRVVIDISQTEPGAVSSPMEVNRGNVRRIDVIKQPVGGGVLTRVEIALVKDREFVASTDPNDRKRLVVNLQPVDEGKSAQAEPQEAPAAEAKEAVAAKAEEKPAAAEVKAPQPAAVEAPAPAPVVAAAPPVEVKPTEVKAADLKGSELKSLDSNAAEVKPTELKVAEVAPAANADAAGGGAVKAEAKEAPARPAPKAAKQAGPKINAVLPSADGVELSIEGGTVQTFNTFKLSKPDRIVLDIFGVGSVLDKKVYPINSLGVASARVGTTPDKARVVLDASGAALPRYEVVKTDLGLKIRLMPEGAEKARVAATPASRPSAPAAEVAPAPVAAAAPAPVVEAPAPVEKAEIPEAPKPPKAPAHKAAEPPVPAGETLRTEVPPARIAKPTLESVDFNIVDGVSRITMKLHGSCQAGQPLHGPHGISLSINNCLVPKPLQRAMNTTKFGSPVLSITPYQVRLKGLPVAKILVRLRGTPRFSMARKGDVLVLDVVNPAPAVAAKLPTAPVVQPARPAAARAPESEVAEELAAAPRDETVTELPRPETVHPPKKVYRGRRVTLEFSDADIRKIFQLIAEVSNLNFLISDDVSGTISLKLVNVPWDQALDVILDAKGLGMQREGNIVQIKPRSKMQTQAEEELAARKAAERNMELRTVVFEINYAAVGEVATQFAALRSERGTIIQDARTNRVIVTDIQPALERMKQLLKTLDAPEKQVMIEARIVEATSSFTRDLGVQWGLNYRDGSASVAGINALDTTFGGVVSTAGPGTTGSGGIGMGMSFGKLTSNVQLDMRLSAAATIGEVKIISTPKVVTLNNKAAKISQGQSIPYQTTSAEGTKTEFVEAALTLEVTPHITADGAVSMKIKASNNSPGTGSPPPINKKEATTELVVSNGETTVIGGIYVDSDTESDTGVPFLSDIPLLGWLFKSNSKQKTKTELLIFITPKVVL